MNSPAFPGGAGEDETGAIGSAPSLASPAGTGEGETGIIGSAPSLASLAGVGERAVAHVLVADVDAPELAADDRHHLQRVLRVRDGDVVTVGDGAGRWRPCRFGPALAPAGDVVTVARPAPDTAVGFAVLKGGRSEMIVQKLTELGVDRIAAFRAARTVRRWDDAAAARMRERWQRVAREAVMQCRRAWLPEIDLPVDFAELDLSQATLAVPGGRALQGDERFVLIGPEGGWSDDELAAVERHAAVAANVLRSETAAVTVAAMLAAHRSGHLPAQPR